MKSEKKSKLFRLSENSELLLSELKGYMGSSENKVIEEAVQSLYDNKINSNYLLMQFDRVEEVIFNQLSLLMKQQIEEMAIMFNDLNRNQRVISILLEMCLISMANISDAGTAKEKIKNSLKYTEAALKVVDENG
ncbi:MAG: hypothetical protein ACK5LZ_04745 [Anaerorhabdus sp.]